MECSTPKITLKRNAQISTADKDVQLTQDKLGSEIAKRMDKIGKEAVFVQYESKFVSNMTFIDTPGIPDEDSSDYDTVVEMVGQLAKPSNRLILCIEEASDNTRMNKLIKTWDPNLSRTTFVYSKFSTQIQLLSSVSLVNRYLSSTVSSPNTFFVSLPSLKTRQKQTTDESYQQRVWQSYHRDMNNLEQIQYDRRFEKHIGIFALRKHLFTKVWKLVQSSIPEVSCSIQDRKKDIQTSVECMKSQLETFHSTKLREIANSYAIEFLQTLDQLIVGTSEGMPTVNGQTLQEEKSSQGDVEWVDGYNHTIRTDPEKWSIPFWNTKVYGGQQFERLLAEFKAVTERIDLQEVSQDDIATASGINKVNNVPNHVWAAADLAQQQSQDSFIPIIEQLQKRAVYVVKRLYDIVDRILISEKKKSAHSTSKFDLQNVYHYPYLTNYIKELFTKFVDKQSKTCRERCMDEFYSSKTIFWETTEFTDCKLPSDAEKNPEEMVQAVSKLTNDIFTTIRERITNNVILKFYNFFLVPLQTELWDDLQKKVATVNDEQLEQYFQVNSTKEKIKSEIAHYESELNKMVELEGNLSQIIFKLIHPDGKLTAPSSTVSSTNNTPKKSVVKMTAPLKKMPSNTP